jgi:hypothetical protein
MLVGVLALQAALVLTASVLAVFKPGGPRHGLAARPARRA